MPILPKYRTEFSNNAEREIFNHAVNSGYFSNNLKRYLFHSLRTQNAKRKLVGEVDFVYLDENFILFLESKGGAVKYDSAADEWWVLGGTKKGDPFKQVTDYLFHFRDNILNEFYPEDNYRSKLIFGYGVMFPDVDKKTSFSKKTSKSSNFKYETIEYDPEIIYSASDHVSAKTFIDYLDKLKTYWRNHDKYNNKKYYGIGLNGVDKIRRIFRKDLIFEIPLVQVVDGENQKIDKYTEEQYEVLDSVDFLINRGFVVSGGPGTGKTILAKELAIRKVKGGANVAFFCFNKNLSAEVSRYFKSIEEGCSINVFHVHGYLYDILKKASLIPSGDKTSEKYWREELPAQFKLWKHALDLQKYDYIILDEGQDIFTENLIDSIFCSLRGGIESGNWSIFIDYKYQGFYEGFDLAYFQLFMAQYPCSMTTLPLNCRNHEDIISVASRHSGLDTMPCRRTNIPFKTKTKFYQEKSELFEGINSFCAEWINGDMDYSNLTILVPEKGMIKEIEDNMNYNFHKVNENAHKVKGEISLSTIHGYKGLENDFIIIAGIEMYFPENKENMSLLYVGYTRAKLGLAVFFSEQNKAKLAINSMK